MHAGQPAQQYVAPARFPLGELHIPSIDLTVCGAEMAAEELWQPVQRRDGDRVCAACLSGTRAPAQELALF